MVPYGTYFWATFLQETVVRPEVTKLPHSLRPLGTARNIRKLKITKKLTPKDSGSCFLYGFVSFLGIMFRFLEPIGNLQSWRISRHRTFGVARHPQPLRQRRQNAGNRSSHSFGMWFGSAKNKHRWWFNWDFTKKKGSWLNWPSNM